MKVFGDFIYFLNKKKRICIVFSVKNYIKCNEMVQMLKIMAFVKVPMSMSRVHKWNKCLKEAKRFVKILMIT